MTRYKKQDPEITRRKFVGAALGASAGVGVLGLVTALGGAKPAFRLTPKKAPPMKGDILVHANDKHPKYKQPVQVSDLGVELVQAWPMGKDKDGAPVIRDGEPNNLLAIFKFKEGELKAVDEAHAKLVMDGVVDGQIVAYSNKCTHAGCPVPNDKKVPTELFCGCHSGQYDATKGCKVIGGPPNRAMPQLPIKLEKGQLVVTDFFVSSPFGYTTEHDWEAFKEKVKEQFG